MKENIDNIMGYLKKRIDYNTILREDIRPNLPPMLKKTIENAYCLKSELEKNGGNWDLKWDDGWDAWGSDYTDIYP